MAGSAGVAAVTSAALATPQHHFRVRPLARAFAVLGEAHRALADAAPAEPIGGANSTVLADSFATGDSVYVATMTDGDICIVDQEPAAPAGAAPSSTSDQQPAAPAAAAPSSTSGLMAVGCSHPGPAEQTGMALVAPSAVGSSARITLLLPNGVQSVTFTRADGTTVHQAVVNNVAQYAAPDLASASYVTPSGQGVTDSAAPSAGPALSAGS
ncbi:MAG: hypothetical protein ABR947_02970 [Solirubrobacteraceae bacterium]|jgi:hypothetical protein